MKAGPAPAGASAEWFEGAGGVRLRAVLFPATGSARGSVVVSPGRTEPIEKYLETARRLGERGFTVLVHDWRGQGLSHRPLPDRLLGHANGAGEFLADFAALLDAFADRLPRPWLALGHSMGGCLTLLALARGEQRFSAAILSAPMLGVRTGAVPRPLARLLAAVMVALGRGGAATPGPRSAAVPFETNIVTRDAERYARNESLAADHPDLALGPPTWGWLKFAFDAGDELRRGAGAAAIALPVTLVLAGDERLVDNRAARTVADRLPRARVTTVPGALHEILQETDEAQAVFWAEFDALADLAAPRAAVPA